MVGKINFDKVGDVASVQSPRPIETGKTDVKTSPDEGVKTSAISRDRVDFSNQAAQVGELVDRIKELPDVRSEKVNAFREKISAGSYNPSSADIAAAILKQESD